MPPPENETAPLRGDGRGSQNVEEAWPNSSTIRDLRNQAVLGQLASDLEVLADWKADLAARIARAQICFETIGITDERRDDLAHETRAFLAVCRHLCPGPR